MKHLILATAGHVDHGKTALIKALTGTDTDRLPEEKLRGITIELGFAHLELGDVSLGIVDVPGHEDFVKNMVAGVGSIDLALLVVAADDGWMPQTEEHLQILSFLEVQHAVVALTKSDLAPPPLEAVHAKLADSIFARAPIIPVSTKTGDGIAELKAELARVCAAIPLSLDFGKPRLAVDRAFTLRGIGTVVTGTLSGGPLRRGQEIVAQPSGVRARIRALQTHNREVEEAGPGMRTALNLPGAIVARGEVITLGELGAPSRAIDILVRRPARPLKHGMQLRFHHGSASVNARIFFAEEGSQLAQLRFEEPIFVFAGDRFVLRDSSARSTIAGGIVLDPQAEERRFRTAAQQEFLRHRAARPDDASVFTATQLVRDHYVKRNEMLRQSRFGEPDLADAIVRGDFLLEPKWWTENCQRAAELIDVFHKTQPNRMGMPLAELRKQVELPELVIAELCAKGFVSKGEAIARMTHRSSLPPALQAAGARIRAALAAKELDPPSIKEMAPDTISQQALRFLRESGEVVEISAELVMRSEALSKARKLVSDFIRARGPATLSDLRQALGSSRRVTVPLMERLDREKLTRRLGDKRTLA